MNELRLSAKIYIWILGVIALAATVLTLMRTEAPSAGRLVVAVALAAAMSATLMRPIRFSVNTHLSLATAVMFAAILLLPPGVAVLVVAVGVLAAHLLRPQDWDQTVFNTAQMTIQTAAGALIMASVYWDINSISFHSLAQVIGLLLAAVTMYLINTLSVAAIIGLQRGERPLRVWARSIAYDRAEYISHVSQLGLGLLAAVIVDAHPWALALLLLPAVAVYSSLERHVQLRQRAEEALSRTQASLATAQRIAHLGSWDWDLDTGQMLWSDEVYRVLGYQPGDFTPTYESYLEAAHPDDRDTVIKALDQTFQEHTVFDIEHRIVQPCGEIRTVHQQAEVIPDDAGKPVRMVGSLHDITERKALEEKLAHQAYHDALTGLPNRALFTERLEQALSRAMRHGEKLAVLFLDLDGFKAINDTLGHEAGDQLLIAAAGRLKECIRPEDTAGRMGGDEFTILLEDITSLRDATQVASRIITRLQEPFILSGAEARVSTSVGIALNAPDSRSPDNLMRNADIAMYRAKNAGKARFVVYDKRLETVEFANLEAELRRALELGEFRVHYQPKLDLDDGRIVGVEALVRWQHPNKGMIEPAAFLHAAEQTGLILPIGRWVIEEACRQARAWHDRYPSRPCLTVSVNVSDAQFHDPNLLADIAQILETTGLPPSSLRLEVSERTIMDDEQNAMKRFGELKELGVQLAIDHFGTGSSNLTFLKRYPLDSLEIDKSFVEGLGEDLRSTSVVRAVIDLARALGLRVVAEGVENPEQVTQLRAMGCEIAQGYYFSRPLPWEAAEALLVEDSGDLT